MQQRSPKEQAWKIPFRFTNTKVIVKAVLVKRELLISGGELKRKWRNRAFKHASKKVNCKERDKLVNKVRGVVCVGWGLESGFLLSWVGLGKVLIIMSHRFSAISRSSFFLSLIFSPLHWLKALPSTFYKYPHPWLQVSLCLIGTQHSKPLAMF